MNHTLLLTGLLLVAPWIRHYCSLALFGWPHESHITTHWPRFGGPMNHILPPTGHWPYFGGPMNHILPPTGRALVAPGIAHYHPLAALWWPHESHITTHWPLALFWWPHESHITTHWPRFGGPRNRTLPPTCRALVAPCITYYHPLATGLILVAP